MTVAGIIPNRSQKKQWTRQNEGRESAPAPQILVNTIFIDPLFIVRPRFVRALVHAHRYMKRRRWRDTRRDRELISGFERGHQRLRAFAARRVANCHQSLVQDSRQNALIAGINSEKRCALSINAFAPNLSARTFAS